jgi:hypothetical protein
MDQVDKLGELTDDVSFKIDIKNIHNLIQRKYELTEIEPINT